MRKGAAVAVACVAVVLVSVFFISACGSSSDKDEIAQTVQMYLAALANGDGAKACDQLTGQQARAVFEGMVLQLPELRATSCADALSKLSGSLGADEKAALGGAETTNVRVDGDSATAELVGGTKTVDLVNADGRWLISGGLSLTP